MSSISPRSEWLTASAVSLPRLALGLDARDQLPARRTYQFDLHERKRLLNALMTSCSGSVKSAV
jgi:hypothetical protein